MFVDISVVAYAGKDNKTFCYLCDHDELTPGQIVAVRFAKKATLGVVRKINVKKPDGVKKFEKITTLPLGIIPPHLLQLADWMIDYYACPASSVWQLMLPKNPSTKIGRAHV